MSYVVIVFSRHNSCVCCFSATEVCELFEQILKIVEDAKLQLHLYTNNLYTNETTQVFAQFSAFSLV